MRRTISVGSLPLEPGRVGFQADSGGRSTMSIVSQCLATLFICVITAVHFNIHPRPAKRGSFWTELRSGGWVIWVWKIGAWVLALLAVEFFAGLAIEDLLIARRDVRLMRERGYRGWTLQMSFFARMGGFDTEEGTARTGIDLVNMLNRRGATSPATLNLEAIEDDISDKTKADGLAKLLAVLQISRFLIGTLARRVKRLPISPLEYVTCSYVLCAMAVYGFWFHKPCGAELPIRLTPNSIYLSPSGHMEAQGPRSPLSSTRVVVIGDGAYYYPAVWKGRWGARVSRYARRRGVGPRFGDSRQIGRAHV